MLILGVLPSQVVGVKRSYSNLLGHENPCHGAHGSKAHLKGRPGKQAMEEGNTKLGNAGCDDAFVSF